MNGEDIHVLLIEDNPGDVLLLKEALVDAEYSHFDLTHVTRLEEAISLLADVHFDLLLVDLTLPDSTGLHTFVQLQEAAPEIPIVVLTGNDDDMLGQEAIQSGAQDFLVKGCLEPYLLRRALRYAVTRHKMRQAIEAVSLEDELTGLCNRRGFLALAQQQIKLADRTGEGLFVFYLDLDNMKEINDTFGHQEGNQALLDTAAILKQTFRESDVVARLGGDEFVVAAIESLPEGKEGLLARLQQNIWLHNQHDGRSYPLEISVGVVRYAPQTHCGIDELVAYADAAMYEQKHLHRSERTRLKT